MRGRILFPNARPASQADATPTNPEPPVTEVGPEGCSCRVGGPGRDDLPAGATLAGVLLVVALIRRRRA